MLANVTLVTRNIGQIQLNDHATAPYNYMCIERLQVYLSEILWSQLSHLAIAIMNM